MSFEIEELMNSQITFPDITRKHSPKVVEKVDKIILEYMKDYSQDLSKLIRKEKISIKLIDIFHRYQQLVRDNKLLSNDELAYHLTVKKNRGHSGVEVIAVSTFPMGKYAGCPANCHFCPKEPEMNFPVILKEKIYEDEEYLSFEIMETSEELLHYTRVISSIIYLDKTIPIQRMISHHKKIIATFFKKDFISIPSNNSTVMGFKTAQPRSYLSGEPAVARANQNQWDCIKQFRDIAIKRIHCGHNVTKVEVIVIGGTWSFYPKDYQEDFIRDIYFSANTLFDSEIREKKSMREEILENRSSKCRIIGLTLETRPDFIKEDEIKRFRSYGCTRVQLGIQHTDDKILKKINRGCTHQQNVKAIRLLKDAGFKVDIHLMPDLPSSSFWKDVKMFEQVLDTEDLQADQWKIYPCQTLEFTKIKEWYEKGEYKPYYEEKKMVYFDDVYWDDYYRTFHNLHPLFLTYLFLFFFLGMYAQIFSSVLLLVPIFIIIVMELTTETRTTNPLHHLLTWVIPKVHPWIRLNRIIRDNPERNIIGGLNKSHYRNEIEDYLEETGRVSQDIRYREIKEREFDENSVRLISRKYQASGGLEYFLSMEDTKNNYLLGFLRLRIPKKLEHYLPELSYSALIRELHVYGWMVPQGEKKSLVQHRGYGKLLLQEAEKLAKKHQFEKIAVISGEGVREYYQKQGYFTEGTFEVKNL
jgi:histone acetyltransferase (RNA polymerase elongator complex component)